MSDNIFVRGLMLAAAVLCIALGVIGIFVPGLPTTVFILMAAWFASKGSPRLSAWLENHKVFGGMIRDWRANRTVSRRAKWSASIMMAVCSGILFLTASRPWIAAVGSLIMLAVALWLWSRPEPTAVTTAPTTLPPG